MNYGNCKVDNSNFTSNEVTGGNVIGVSKVESKTGNTLLSHNYYREEELS
jgi:hypothetical protein